jgi:two-component system response regulator YesN
MESACRLLYDENVKISDIATALGYQDQNYFARLFKKTKGMSPTDYRIMLQKKAQLC